MGDCFYINTITYEKNAYNYYLQRKEQIVVGIRCTKDDHTGGLMRKLKIAMIQMIVVFDELEKNILHAAELVKEAVEKGAEICILPECLDLGWGNLMC